MPAIDYYGIEEAVKTVLEADTDFQATGAKVFIEEEFVHGMADIGKAVMIYLDKRRPTPGQPAAAGQQTRYQMQLSLWTRAFFVESIRRAINERDDLLGVVEVALMRKRSLNDAVSMLWLEGGEFMTGKSSKPHGFLAAAETVLTVEKKTTTI